MASVKKKVTLAFDLMSMAGQVFSVVGSTGTTLHYLDTHAKNYYWKKKARESNWMFAPSIMWFGAFVVVVVNIQQLRCTIKWFRENDHEHRQEEIDTVTRSWLRWNVVGIGVGILWFFFFGLALLFENMWPPLSAFGLFAVHIVIRAILAGVVSKLSIPKNPSVIAVHHHVDGEDVEVNFDEEENGNEVVVANQLDNNNAIFV